jgi:hypothetical protein
MRAAAGLVVFALALASAACSASLIAGGHSDAGPHNDGAAGNDAPSDGGPCQVTLNFTPSSPLSNTTVTATATLRNAGSNIPTYTWSVSFEGSKVTTSPNGSSINFLPEMAGIYVVDVDPAITGCAPAIDQLTVGQTAGMLVDYLGVVIPPLTLAPPQQTLFDIAGSANLPIETGLRVTGTITDSTGSGISAYVRFMPPGEPHAVIETFTASDGTFGPFQMLGQPSYTALIVPAVPGLAPVATTWTPNVTTAVAVATGTAIAGTVLDPTGAPLAGASVQLTDGTVPSTIATTNASGAFTVLGSYASGASVTATVTPPSGRGLPALSARVTFGAMQVQYAPTLATCGVGGIAVQRAGVNQPSVGVTFVGAVATAGTITVGGVATPATGSVQIATTTSATGTLPTLAVPKAQLSAVVAVAPSQGDYAVASVDLSACSTATIAAPPPQPISATITDATGNPLAGVLARWMPDGALAASGALELDATTGSAGALSAGLASGGQYDLLLNDPQGRAAPVLISSLTGTSVPASLPMTKAIVLQGTVSGLGSASIPNIPIQIYCASASCMTTGNGPVLPIAQTVTNASGGFQVAIPSSM